MKVDIFIRSYDKDANFLDLCLSSYRQNGAGYGEIVVVGDGVTDGMVRAICEKHNVHYQKDDSARITSGYIAQQYSKLCAPKWLDGEFILYVDSDCVFVNKHSPDEWFKDGKPIMLWDEWDEVGQAICWKRSTEFATHLNAPYETMRRLPMLYPRDTIKRCVGHLEAIHGDLRDFMCRTREISEFNVLGTYCWHHEHDKFTWLNGKENAKEWPIRQYWSHNDYHKAKANYEMQGTRS